MSKTKTIDVNDPAMQAIRGHAPKGSTIFCVLRGLSASGMQRRIDFYRFVGGEPRFLTGSIARVLGMKQHKDGGLVVRGGGMDMGFHIVEQVSQIVHGSGSALESRWL